MGGPFAFKDFFFLFYVISVLVRKCQLSLYHHFYSSSIVWSSGLKLLYHFVFDVYHLILEISVQLQLAKQPKFISDETSVLS